MLKVTMEDNDALDQALEKFTFKKAVRITAFVKRFIENCRLGAKERIKGPIIKSLIKHKKCGY
eukprot:gene5031-5689_t